MEENNVENTDNKPKNIDQKQLASAILIAGVLIAGAILLKGNTTPTNTNNTLDDNKPKSVTIRPVGKDEHILGNANAKVVVIEYSDTECPFCKMFHKTMHQVIEERGDKVAWVYRHYPIPQLHAKALNEAVATECAWEQGGNEIFWKYTDEIYARTPSNDGLDEKELPAIAAMLGLNMTSFESCLASQKYENKIQNDIDSGDEAGARGTPSSFILKNGKVVDTIAGAQPLNIVMSKIDQALK